MNINGIEYLTVLEAAADLDYSERYTRRLIAESKLAATKIGTARMVEKASVEAYKERRS